MVWKLVLSSWQTLTVDSAFIIQNQPPWCWTSTSVCDVGDTSFELCSVPLNVIGKTVLSSPQITVFCAAVVFDGCFSFLQWTKRQHSSKQTYFSHNPCLPDTETLRLVWKAFLIQKIDVSSLSRRLTYNYYFFNPCNVWQDNSRQLSTFRYL